MSAASAARAARPRPAPAPAPRLTLVRAPEQLRTRVPFVLACMATLIAALVLCLVLNTSMAQVAFRTTATTKQLTAVQQDNQDLQAQLDHASSPAQLAAAARALGMVPASGTGWVRLSDRTVAGDPTPAP